MRNTSANNSAIAIIFFTILIDMIGVGIIVPVIPELITTLTGDNLSNSAWIGGLLIISYSTMQFFFAPIMGQLSDKFGRRPILLLSLLGLSLDYFVHAFALTIGWLFVGRLIAGIFGASHTVATAYIADISTPENKAKNFGLIGAAFGLGFVIGPAIGGLVGGTWGVKAPFIVAGLFSLLNFIFGWFLIPESLIKENRSKIDYSKMIPFVALAHLRKYKAILGFVFAFALASMAGQVMPSVWNFYTVERYSWSEMEIGISLMVVGASVSIVQAFLTGKMVKKFGNKNVIIIGFTCWTIGMFSFVLANNVFYLYAAVIPYVFGGIAGPTIRSVISNKVSNQEQGNLQGVLTSLVSLAAIIGPITYTFLFSEFTAVDTSTYFPAAPFLLATIILIAATIIAIRSLKLLTEKIE